ncbi:MAG: hypothetical protein F6K40_37045 [Okeania sp. SIO3I5]|uniref:hypothetical protein n=1 Tax=Okeania sp. SIO3I5 TaxID=2607805 RepID=UPI0013BA9326|nr:hypothetical protein [Okeania sp. SIO3I5]NEQ41503.1 hypothetical protein [Okeania sp. SIO3I5]
MVLTQNYWTLCKIDLTSSDISGSQKGYRQEILSDVQQQFQTIAELKELSSQDDRKIQATLLSYFRSQNSADSNPLRITAGLSLRCYISHAIVSACQKLVQEFGDRYRVRLRDVLYLVLTDDGKTKNIKHLQENSQSSYCYFWEEILINFNPEQSGLWYWTNFRTRRHPELNQTLWVEFGLSLATPWAKLNDIKRYQMKNLSRQERDVVEVFHGVYRRDRREQGARGKCPEPSESQLQEMRNRLFPRGIVYNSSELFEQLIAIAQSLQEQTLSLEEQTLDPTETSGSSDDDFAALIKLLQEHRDQSIMDAIKEELSQRLQKLQKGRYRELAHNFLPSLRLIYCENKSQTEVARQLNMNNQSQVSRILKLTQILKQIREQVMEKMLQILLNQAGLNSSQGVLDPNALDSLIEQLTKYLDETVFIEATKEISAGRKYKRMTSLFAEKMRYHLKYS